MSRTAPRTKSRFSLSGLGIRASLTLAFGAMSAVMLIAATVALYSTTRMSESLSVILDQRLPVAVQTLKVVRAADALAATGVPLASVATGADRTVSFERADTARAALFQALTDLERITAGLEEVRALVDELSENLGKMQAIVDQRLEIEQNSQVGRERLLSNLQTFKQHLTYRVRILEGDSDVIGKLLSQPVPPMDQVTAMVRRTVSLTPVSRFYTEIETIAGRVLVAVQDPTPTSLQFSKEVLQTALDSASVTFSELPTGIARDLEAAFADLKDIVLADTGLVALREHRLALDMESQKLIRENHRITRLVEAATASLAQGEFDAMVSAGGTINETRQRYTRLLLFVTGLGLIGIVALMHVHVMRNVIVRLSWLSAAMQNVAAGNLETQLPPAGDDELGRLASATEAERREADLRQSREHIEKARAELEQKARELEQANRKLEELSATDFLTGLANRRRFDEVLGVEWSRALRTDQPLSLIMIDVDHFKNFNDRYGHQAGDECLRRIASSLKANTGRAGDLVARYGGEEFCIISASTGVGGAHALAEKIRLAVQSLAMRSEVCPLGIVTISLGVAIGVPGRTQSARELVQKADMALYEAKADGRNCTRIADES
jgi:diguanylate cyclase (GGDEF)-like protein